MAGDEYEKRRQEIWKLELSRQSIGGRQGTIVGVFVAAPSEEELPRFWQWLKAAEQHPAVVPTIHDQQEMLDFYQSYAKKKGALATGEE